MRSFSVILLSAILLGGCAATGPTFKEHLAASAPTPPTSARLVFFRTRDTEIHGGMSASVNIDGNPATACDLAGFSVVDAAPGTRVVTVSAATIWGLSGTCDLGVELTGGKRYYFEIKPREAHHFATVVGAFLGFGLAQRGGSGALDLPTVGDTARAALGGAGASVLGGAIESAGRWCGGPFSIESIADDDALPRVMNLRLTER